VSEYKRVTRSVKHEKRQKQKRKILFFASLAILFLIVFISLILFGNKGNPQEASVDSSEEQTEETEDSTKSNTTNSKDDTTPDDTTIESEESEDNTEEEIEIEEIPSDDSNVKTAYKGDWDPIGTKQEGPHTINYNDGSDDRVEIKEAVVKVTELDENDMIEHWIGRGGDQAVIATVYNSSYEESIDEIYRVYLQWIDEEGWQPTKVEELKHLP